MPSDRTARPFAVRRLLGLAAAVTIASLASVDVAAAQQWRDEANARIDQHRKGDMTVRVFDAAGNRVQGADVGVSMLNHNFGFGTAVTAELLTANSQDATNYRNAIRNNFNHVVFENDLKWPAWEGQWGPNFNWTQTQQAMDWLDANNLPARGHYLSWATWTGFDAYGDSQNVNTLKTRLFDHITEKATTVGDRVYEWDVINHPVGWTNDTYVNRMQDAGLYNNGLDFYADIIRHSRSVVPDGTDLWINEDNIMSGGLASEYADIIEYLNDNGAAVDGIGFQGHFNADWNRIRTPQQVYNNIDRFAGLADRLRVTEFDINVGTESEQAELTRDYLTVMFSHEKMEAVTFWGFWEGRHWLENAHLINEDWTEKPAMAAYRDLVFDEWWTEEDLDASELGEAELRAFLGAYEITASLGHGEATAYYTLSSDGQSFDVVLRDFLLGDANADQNVNLADFLILRDNFGEAGVYAEGDFNDDGVIDLQDFLILRDNFGEGLDTAPLGNWLATIPEPMAASVLLVPALLLRRRR